MTLLILKHFFCDFPLQGPYMYKNKGTYGHPGGLLHAGVHVAGTFLCVAVFSPAWATAMALFDGVIHYHVDWAKMKTCASLNLKPDNSESFWILLGLDQLLHYMTYVLIVALMF